MSFCLESSLLWAEVRADGGRVNLLDPFSSSVCIWVGLIAGFSSKYENLSTSSSSGSAHLDLLDVGGESLGRNLVRCPTISSVREALMFVISSISGMNSEEIPKYDLN